MIYRNDWLKLGAFQLAAQRLTKHIPFTAGLVVKDIGAIVAKGQGLPINLTGESIGSAHIPASGDRTHIQRRSRSGLPENNNILPSDCVVGNVYLFQGEVRVCYCFCTHVNREHTSNRRQLVRDTWTSIQKRRVVDVVITRIWVAPIRAVEARLT